MNNNAFKPDMIGLVAIMAALRTPGSGCPWDLEQSFETIAPYTIEEAYEVADAIARGDRADLKDELGDLLFQVVYHARMAEEEGSFAFPDVVAAIVAKMLRRHPHVFGGEAERKAGAAPGFWERLKAEEKNEKAAERARLAAKGGGEGRDVARLPGLLSDVPAALPALSRAVKLQGKAARVGFDWPSLAPVFAKLREEIDELEEVVGAADPRGEGEVDRSTERLARVAEELGDMLFVVANVARHLQLDPEEALRAANRKFERRFAHIEARLAELGRSPAQSTLAEMDRLWDEVRAADKRGMGEGGTSGG